MEGKVAIVLAAVVLLASGCVSSPAPATGDCGGCPDKCEGAALIGNGTCHEGTCMFTAASCAFGCSAGACLPQPPHLQIADPEQTRGNFTVRIEGVDVEYGQFRDDYTVSLSLWNTGNGSSVFAINAVSLLSKAGIMQHATGFTWSDMLLQGEERKLSFTIRRVPDDRRDEDTTLIIRTNQGQYSFPATFSG